MTITYPNGTVLPAVVLSRGEEEIRAIAPGCDDVLVFTRIRGTWVSEELEPVTIEFGIKLPPGRLRNIPTTTIFAPRNWPRA